MIKVLFICHGNICRSPMAEFIFKDIVKKRGVGDRFFVSSCAASTEEIGHGIYPPAKAELTRRGVPFTEHRAVQLRKSDYEEYDLLVCMDSMNVRWSERITGGDPDNKICRLMKYTGEDRDVDDPWYSGDFDAAFSDIKSGCEALLETLLEEK